MITLIRRWNGCPLYWRILCAMSLALPTGLMLGEKAAVMEVPSKVILQLLGALAPPLILIAVTHVLMTTVIQGRTAGRLAFLLILNAVVANLIGLSIASLIQPGTWKRVAHAPAAAPQESAEGAVSPVELLVRNVPPGRAPTVGGRYISPRGLSFTVRNSIGAPSD